MIQLFIKNHKPLPCKQLNHHKLIPTANIVLHIFLRDYASMQKLVKQKSNFFELYFIYCTFSK